MCSACTWQRAITVPHNGAATGDHAGRQPEHARPPHRRPTAASPVAAAALPASLSSSCSDDHMLKSAEQLAEEDSGGMRWGIGRRGPQQRTRRAEAGVLRKCGGWVGAGRARVYGGVGFFLLIEAWRKGDLGREGGRQRGRQQHEGRSTGRGGFGPARSGGGQKTTRRQTGRAENWGGQGGRRRQAGAAAGERDQVAGRLPGSFQLRALSSPCKPCQALRRSDR